MKIFSLLRGPFRRSMSTALALDGTPALSSTSLHNEVLVEVPELALVSPSSDLPSSSSDRIENVLTSTEVSRKRPRGPDLTVPERNRNRRRKPSVEEAAELKTLPDTKYYFENGLRKVEPYYYTWTTYAKGRWVGRTIEEVFRDEFLAVNEEVTEQRINADPSNLFINGMRVKKDHKLKDGDYLAHYMHRHEAPVTAQPIRIIAETDNMLVVDKPASIPVHPCGRFCMNSVTHILATEFGRKDLRIAHRLDRLTSGLLIFTKNIATSQGLQNQMVDRSVQKEYIARVAGSFPDEPVVCQDPIECVNVRAGIYQVRPNGRHSVTEFQRLSFDPLTNTSIVHCKPRTGRTHQIRVHLQHIGFPIANDPFYGPKSSFTGEAWGEVKKEDRLGRDFTEECQKQRFSKFITLPEKPWIDPKCPECWVDFTDPLPEDMRIDLHAWKYEGPGWNFETELPFWAKDAKVPVRETLPDSQSATTVE